MKILDNKITKWFANIPEWLAYSAVVFIIIEGLILFTNRQMTNNFISSVWNTELFQDYTAVALITLILLILFLVLFFKLTNVGRWLFHTVISIVIIFMAINMHRTFWQVKTEK